MKKILFILLSIWAAALSAQHTKSLVYSNPLIGGNEGVWQIVSFGEGFLVVAPGICLPAVKGCTSIRNYSYENQVLWETFWDTIAPPHFKVIATSDSAIYMASWYRSPGVDEEYINKLDLQGNVLKTVQVDYEANPKGENKAIVNVSLIGDTVVICHNKWLYPGPDSLFLKYYDKDLNLVKELKLTENLKDDVAYGIHVTPDSNYLISKLTGYLPYYLHIMKTDRQGNVLWVHEDTLNRTLEPFQNFMVTNDKDSSYTFFSFKEESIKTPVSQFPWVRDYSVIFKRSAIDNSLIWYKPLLSFHYSLIYFLSGLPRRNDGSMIGGGMADRNLAKDKKPVDLVGWLFKIDPAGELKWSRFYKDDRYEYFGSYFVTATELSNGDLVAGGDLDQLSIDPPGLSWVLHLDSMGCLTPGCVDTMLYTRTEEVNGKLLVKEVFFKSFPNPVHDRLSVEFYNQSHRPASLLRVLSIDGKEYYRTELHNGDKSLTVNMSGYPPGMYLVQYSSGSLLLQTEKVVKE